MAKLITRMTKRPGDQWILMSDTSLFTEDEIANIITPYFDYVKSLPGIKIQTPPPAPVMYDDTLEGTLQFETEADALNARELLFFKPTDPAVLNKNALMRQKMQTAGAVYSLNIILEG